ncbi:MAG TPA: sulfatase-like hydrolase/transferase [bacterium]|nr:sulfatase-like hydrolase/transferase [bacterium]
MKLFLGLYMFDKAGNESILFLPPFSLTLVVHDIIFCFFLSYLIDSISLKKRTRFFLLSWMTFPFIYYYSIKGYIIYLYFHGYVNYGLNMFLGSKGNETVNFVLYVLDIYAVLFLVSLLFVTVIYLVFGEKFGKYIERKYQYVPFSLFTVSLMILPFQISFSEKFERIERNPLYELAWSYIAMPGYLPKDFSQDFKPPDRLIFAERERSSLIDKGEIKKNKGIILIMIESLPYNKKEKALFFDQISDRSLEFTNFRAFFPGTTRSLISSMCGTYSGTDFSALTRYQPDFKCTSVQQLLSGAGYRTGLFSAVNLTYDDFDKAEMLKYFDLIEEPATLTKKYKPKKIHGTGNAIEEEIVIDEIISFMKKDKGPFFVYYYVYWTHSPYEHPFKDIGHLGLEERYDESLKYVSESISKLFAKMKEENLFEETVIIATADHGQAFGQHKGNYTHSNYLYEESIKVPLVIKSPDLPKGQQKVDVNSSHFDVPSTILDFAGIGIPDSWDGQSLISGYYVEKPILLFTRGIIYSDGILDGEWKYIYSPRDKKEEFYNLSADPFERKNLADEKNEMTKKYKELINEWIPYQQKKITEKRGK